MVWGRQRAIDSWVTALARVHPEHPQGQRANQSCPYAIESSPGVHPAWYTPALHVILLLPHGCRQLRRRWARCRRRMNMNQQLPVGPSCRSRDAPRAAMSSGSRKRQAPSSQGRQVRPRASSEDPDYVADALPLDG